MRRLLVRFAFVAAALSVGLMAASPAQAADGPAVLNSAHVGKTAGFQEECTGPFKSLPSGYDGWHFVLPATSGTSFLSATLTFSSPGGTVTVGPVTSTDSANPTKAGDNSWYAYFDNAGAAEKHLYVFTAVGWTLTGGTAQVTDVSADAFFNLSHTCKGTGASSSPSPSTSSSPSPGASQTPTPGVSESESVPGTSVSPSPSSSGGLPVTGVAWGAMVLTAVALIAAGAGLLAVRRRRELTEHDAA
jgi:LPXTG-motif cell wall-anchored protein